MSGIYIPGMEMPDTCFSCPMNDADCCGISKGSYIEYRDVDFDIAINGRPDWCPLVPVPPHGRLIDADALLQDLIFPNKQFEQGMRELIEDAPTIIEKEVSE